MLLKIVAPRQTVLVRKIYLVHFKSRYSFKIRQGSYPQQTSFTRNLGSITSQILILDSLSASYQWSKGLTAKYGKKCVNELFYHQKDFFYGSSVQSPYELTG